MELLTLTLRKSIKSVAEGLPEPSCEKNMKTRYRGPYGEREAGEGYNQEKGNPPTAIYIIAKISGKR